MRRRLILIFSVLLLLASCCAAPQAVIVYPDPMVHKVLTDDDWHIGLIHLEPTGPKKNAPLVILCHGVTSTSAAFDLGNGHGLGPYLAARGYDVWLLNLRGRGPSAKPADSPRYKFSWRFEDYLDRDLPATIDYVQRATGKEQVTWIGHSMGGMLIFAYLGKYGQQEVDKIVTLGSPVEFEPLSDSLRFASHLGTWHMKPGRVIHANQGALMMSRTAAGHRNLFTSVINPDNPSRETTTRYAANAVPDLSG